MREFQFTVDQVIAALPNGLKEVTVRYAVATDVVIVFVYGT